MSAISYFLAILALSLLSSALLISWQQRALGPLLEASCPGSGAHYWRHTLGSVDVSFTAALAAVLGLNKAKDATWYEYHERLLTPYSPKNVANPKG
ncbi:hypothetical protein [Iodobacter fluviatilis]|uniref:Uncharacterized protein n=1 Tax=Iodobacter fluviatilis TaxID=537 RepID=A0A377Q3V0_9NEIS|nr:hypothetical protein [Iodobacter fluviatilis]TCU90445.1 hypothetical protein EV682_101478 [Iodobacter fluviatilis]STQ89472.1 Uncharacterised protein [Iodobacter fluviatilis]